MKKLLTLIAFASIVSLNMNAQNLYKTVRDAANKVVNDPNAKQEMIDNCQFQITALNYLTAQVSKRGLQKTGLFYDSQAVSLKSFVEDCYYYLLKAERISAAKKKQVMDCYKNASLNNPMFKDTDKKTTNVYVRDSNTNTPFSLDTDWDKAYEEATRNIQAIIK